jgi:hypothetical protein
MKTTLPLAATEESALIVEGSVSAALVTLLQTAVLRMIPYAIPGLFLLVLDLLYGIRAAKVRGEKVRASTAIRRSMTKLFSYLCWLILATTVAIAFGRTWLEWGTLALVYGNEGLSIIGNYLESKGLAFSMLAVYRWILKLFAKKVDGEMSDEEAADILKPRDKNGSAIPRRYTKKEKK